MDILAPPALCTPFPLAMFSGGWGLPFSRGSKGPVDFPKITSDTLDSSADCLRFVLCLHLPGSTLCPFLPRPRLRSPTSFAFCFLISPSISKFTELPFLVVHSTWRRFPAFRVLGHYSPRLLFLARRLIANLKDLLFFLLHSGFVSPYNVPSILCGLHTAVTHDLGLSAELTAIYSMVPSWTPLGE